MALQNFVSAYLTKSFIEIDLKFIPVSKEDFFLKTLFPMLSSAESVTNVIVKIVTFQFVMLNGLLIAPQGWTGPGG